MKSVLIIYTGGTIGMKEDPADGTLKPFDFSQIKEEVPELNKFDVRIDSVTFDPLIDSSDVEPSLWVELARLIQDKYEEYDGFVILHGTDTMAYSASTLSFMLEGLSKPVVFTGSQLPIGMPRTDGKERPSTPSPPPTVLPWPRQASTSATTRTSSGSPPAGTLRFAYRRTWIHASPSSRCTPA